MIRSLSGSTGALRGRVLFPGSEDRAGSPSPRGLSRDNSGSLASIATEAAGEGSPVLAPLSDRDRDRAMPQQQQQQQRAPTTSSLLNPNHNRAPQALSASGSATLVGEPLERVPTQVLLPPRQLRLRRPRQLLRQLRLRPSRLQPSHLLRRWSRSK